jgi:hypothetical protein
VTNVKYRSLKLSALVGLSSFLLPLFSADEIKQKPLADRLSVYNENFILSVKNYGEIVDNTKLSDLDLSAYLMMTKYLAEQQTLRIYLEMLEISKDVYKADSTIPEYLRQSNAKHGGIAVMFLNAAVKDTISQTNAAIAAAKTPGVAGALTLVRNALQPIVDDTNALAEVTSEQMSAPGKK